jgi:hypothetical protein
MVLIRSDIIQNAKKEQNENNKFGKHSNWLFYINDL